MILTVHKTLLSIW